MNTISEGALSAQNILRRVQPTRHLYEGKRYTPSHETNIARTFRTFERLARMKAKQS